jgi:hypothetical protein
MALNWLKMKTLTGQFSHLSKFLKERSNGLNSQIDRFDLSINAYFSRIANFKKMHTFSLNKIKPNMQLAKSNQIFFD